MLPGEWDIAVTDLTMLGRIVKNLELWTRKPLRVDLSPGAWRVRMLRAVQTMEAWLCEVSEGSRDSVGPFP